MDQLHDLSCISFPDNEDERYFLGLMPVNSCRPFPIYKFSNGQELLAYLNRHSAIRADQAIYGLLIMDMAMSIMNGLEAIRHVRANPAWQHLSILMLSTDVCSDTIKQVLQEGANGYVVKRTSSSHYVWLFDEFFAHGRQKLTDTNKL
ncbi:response regulator [Spirosoma foliorum]|uniref:Response regulator n=1 Tax=Spirosoma foliorum TaxID=2710596 RepID=A0A7G5GX55_9BACT|nr:response regulator [Spirosoma foliorum]QMW03447.1 response regulator [Spirosoma foliorum]